MTGNGNPAETRDVGINAYIYLYPLVTMDLTRKQAINIEPGKRPGFGPMNTFSHIRQFPLPTSGPWCGRTSTRCTPPPGST